jgi:hypothetical protein
MHQAEHKRGIRLVHKDLELNEARGLRRYAGRRELRKRAA